MEILIKLFLGLVTDKSEYSGRKIEKIQSCTLII